MSKPTQRQPLARLKFFWSKKGHYDKLIIIGSLVFLAFAAFFVLAHRVFFTADQFYVLGLVVALIIGQAQAFIWDWTPLVLVIFSYEYFRGLVPLVDHHVHFYLMPQFDLLLFRRIPSYVLQQKYFRWYHIHWYDYAAVTLYLMHFITPLLVGFFFWLTDRPYFKAYAIGIVVLSYLTFLTYLLFPAAPPWMASQAGLIPQVNHITTDIVGHMLNYVAVPSVYRFFGDNLVAAVPSLHAAYPLLTALFIGKKYPKAIPILILYVLGVWVAVIYLGEHYFFDVFLGAIYALFVYAAVLRLEKYLEKKKKLTAVLS